MSFLEVDIYHGSMISAFDEIHKKHFMIEFHYFDNSMRNNCSEIEKLDGYFSRLSAPGYMDYTEWIGPFETEEEAILELDLLHDLEDDQIPNGYERMVGSGVLIKCK